MKMTVKFEGGEELAAKLNALSTRISRRLALEALTEAAEPMRKRMASGAPREPGAPDLADHIVISRATMIGSTEGGKWRSAIDSKESAVAVGPAREFFYGLMQEYGTVYHGAHPFMRPAFDSEAQRALTILIAALWRELAGRGIGRSISAPAMLQGEV